MRLSAVETFFQSIAHRLDTRLETRSDRPLAIAFSGGGDSLALLLAAQDWVGRVNRRLIVLTVDHRLRPESARWTALCMAHARRLGLEHKALVWEGDKPSAGRSAAARTARHTLLAEAAREAGARVILMGHTADDRQEAAAMRLAGSTVSSPREWAPSPVWPKGRDVFVFRPMLDLRRAELRRVLTRLGETWIEDPANSDPSSLRARARAAGGFLDMPEEAPPDLRPLQLQSRVDWAGQIVIPRAALARADPAAGKAFLSAGFLCAAGGARPPRGRQLDAISSIGDPAETFTGRTLAGARLDLDAEMALIVRDAGSMGHGEEIEAPPDRPIVFDGRFELAAPTEGWRLASSAGRLSRLARAERDAVKSIPTAARRALPVAIDRQGVVVCPLLRRAWRARNLIEWRLTAACGVIQDEATLSHVGETEREALNQSRLSEGLVHELA